MNLKSFKLNSILIYNLPVYKMNIPVQQAPEASTVQSASPPEQNPNFFTIHELRRELNFLSKEDFDKYVAGVIRRWKWTQNCKRHVIVMVLICVVMLFFSVCGTIQRTSRIAVELGHHPTCEGNPTCDVTFELKTQMTGLVKLVFVRPPEGLDYGLNINYVGFQQLTGQTLTPEFTQICFPYITNADMNVTLSKDGELLDPNEIANPCGRLAYSFPNYKYTFIDSNNNTIETQHPSCGDVKYFRQPKDNSKRWIDIKNHLLVHWLVHLDFMEFHLLVFPNGMPAGNYTMKVEVGNQPLRTRPIKLKIVQEGTRLYCGLFMWVMCVFFVFVCLVVALFVIYYASKNSLKMEEIAKQTN